MLQKKLEMAQHRKESLRRELKSSKNIEAIESFQKHWVFREQSLLKNIELYELYEKTRQENIMVGFNSTLHSYHNKRNLLSFITETSNRS